MRRTAAITLAVLLFAACTGLGGERGAQGQQRTKPVRGISHTYLGFDRNSYPGDAALRTLRKTFSFSSYWLNTPPGEASNTWQGKRGILTSNGFGFLVVFNGRAYRELKSAPDAGNLGERDAAAAAEAAKKEGFSAGTVIFLDQEEGGRLLPEQRAYVHAWIDGIDAAGYRAGVYCSGVVAKEAGGAAVVTANDIRGHAGERKIVFWVYNDSCPPSPGCVLTRRPLSPKQSGVPSAAVWQFAQSPRRRAETAGCPANYDSDGNCYAPLFQGRDRVYVDLDAAISPDPSEGRR